jgi:hypothetical protein
MKKPEAPIPDAADKRKQRLAAALRSNMAKRKVRSRGLAEGQHGADAIANDGDVASGQSNTDANA